MLIMMSKNLLLSIVCSTLFLFSAAQQKEIRYLSGTDNRNTVSWDFFLHGWKKCGILDQNCRAFTLGAAGFWQL